MLNLVVKYPQPFELKLPKALVPRRKYEVDESMWLVKFGRAQLAMLDKRGAQLMGVQDSAFASLSNKKLSLSANIARQMSKPALFFSWRRIPKDWELNFVDSMKEMEAQGIPFFEVLSTELPSVIGDAPSEVLLRWVGRGGRSQPKRFLNAVHKMFGKSSRRIVVGLVNQLDPQKMLDSRKAPEEPFQSVIDAINEADSAKADAFPYKRRRYQSSSHA